MRLAIALAELFGVVSVGVGLGMAAGPGWGLAASGAMAWVGAGKAYAAYRRAS
jgi:hypothetical protein